MKTITALFVATSMLVASTAIAQQLPLPGPFGQPESPFPQHKCTDEYVDSVRQMRDAYKAWRTVPETGILEICSLIEQGERMARAIAEATGQDPEEALRGFEDQIKDFGKPLGIPRLDLRFVKHACVQTAGEASRYIVTEIGRLEAELQRCSGI